MAGRATRRVAPSILRSVLCLVAALALTAIPVACGGSRSAERVSLPTTPVLSIRSTWAVVKSTLLRVREEATSQSVVLSHIRMGAVLEVLTRSDTEATIEGETGYWYRIDYDGLKGWVFGSYLEVFDSKAKAEQYAASLQ
jgi:uncharacterized protein YgiM (DUF1202 family)